MRLLVTFEEIDRHDVVPQKGINPESVPERYNHITRIPFTLVKANAIPSEQR